jgi:hypothetical protein
MLIILLLVASIIYCAPIPPLTRLDVSALPTQRISGTITTDATPFGIFSITGNVTITNDPNNQRWRLSYQQLFPTSPTPTQVDGYIWVLPNATYSKGGLLNPNCLIVPNFNWTVYVNAYNNAFAEDDSNFPGWSEYLGQIRDYASCGSVTATKFKFLNNEYRTLDSSYNILINGNFCYNTKTVSRFDGNTISYGPDFSADFVLPSDCWPNNNPQNFCDFNPTC